MRKQPKKSKPLPRTNLRWASRTEYDEAVKAAGNLPLASHVRDTYLRAIRNSRGA